MEIIGLFSVVVAVVSAVASWRAARATEKSADASLRAARATEKSADAWRAQLVEQTRQEAAQRLLVAIYVLGHRVKVSRSPYRIGYSAPDDPNLSAKERERMRREEDVRGVWKQLDAVFVAHGELGVAREQARAVLGSIVDRATDPILKVISELFAAASAFQMFNGLPDPEKYRDEMLKERLVLFDIGSKEAPNEYAKRLEEARAASEAVLVSVAQPAAAMPDAGSPGLGSGSANPQLPPKAK